MSLKLSNFKTMYIKIQYGITFAHATLKPNI